ncbi:MAG TPA: phosphodiester glycosidase family protein [Candidatus Saccharimonadales bacterium]|nr:phosphodiester glycosidase family protein [Candidatus Saccharimonadales bacterium]
MPHAKLLFARLLWLAVCLAALVVQMPAGGLQAGQVFSLWYCGVTMITRTETAPRPLSMHIVLIDLLAPGLRFKLTPPSGTRETVRQSPLGFLRQEQAQLAINTHFYLPFTTPDTDAYLIGLAASDGRVYSGFEGQPIGTNYQDQSYAIVPFAPALNIDASNHASIVHWDPAYADNRHVLEPVTLWTAFCGSAQIIQDGHPSIPTYSGSPGGLTATNGYSDSLSWYNVLRARTIAGLTRDRSLLVLFTVDEVRGSYGMTVPEVVELVIRDYGVYDALNLDGDGSTALAMQDPVTGTGLLMNTPSGGLEGRAVGCNLAVFALNMGIPSQPRLALVPAGNDQLRLSWRAPSIEWELQQAPSALPLAWQPCGFEPSLAGGCWHVLLPAREPAVFYRLAPKTPRCPGCWP